jgi:hypothetical protein
VREAAPVPDEVYAAIAKEIEDGSVNQGLWTRLLVENEGDPVKTKVAYIKARVEAESTRAEIARTTAYFLTFSASENADGGSNREFYASMVNYHGDALSIDEVMKRIAEFCRLWPKRAYTIRPSSVTASRPAANACTVQGIVDWKSSNDATGVHSTGSTEFMFTFRNGLIEVEETLSLG